MAKQKTGKKQLGSCLEAWLATANHAVNCRNPIPLGRNAARVLVAEKDDVDVWISTGCLINFQPMRILNKRGYPSLPCLISYSTVHVHGRQGLDESLCESASFSMLAPQSFRGFLFLLSFLFFPLSYTSGWRGFFFSFLFLLSGPAPPQPTVERTTNIIEHYLFPFSKCSRRLALVD